MLRTLLKDYSILIFVRVASRVIDFFLKIFVIRAIDPNIFATTVHFELITNVALFYTKTCLKNSYQKRAESLTDREMAISASNLMLVGVPISMVVATFMVGSSTLFSSANLNYFFAAAALHGLAAVIESLQECFMAKLVLEMKYDRIGRNELISLLIKSSVLWVSLYMGWFHQYGVLIFGVSQLDYSLALLVLTYVETGSGSYLLKTIKCNGKEQYVHDNMKNAAKEFSLISVVKLVLQQLEKIVLVAFNIPTMSSDFSLVSKLGSVIPKYTFAPLEEIGFNIFSKDKQNEEHQVTITTLFRILIIIGLLIVVFGVCYSEAILLMLVGKEWATSSAVNSLRVYCVYILFMGLNGISEAFVYARIKNNQMSVFRTSMVVTTVVYLACCIIFVQLGFGAPGIFLASTVSMICRIIVCWRVYIHKEVFGGISNVEALRTLFPRARVMVLYLASFWACWNIKDYFSSPFLNFAVGGVIFVINALYTMLNERDILAKLQKIRKENATPNREDTANSEHGKVQ